MGSASIQHLLGRWILQVDDHTWAYDSREEAVRAAQRELHEEGGEITIHAGGDAEAKTVEVPARGHSTAPKTLGDLSFAFHQRGSAPSAPPADGKTPTAGGTTDIAAEAAELRVRYQEARSEIDNLTDPLERDIGLGTLRLEANYTVDQLRASGVGVTEEDLRPLTTYITALNGGERTESAIKRIDQTSESVLVELGKTLLGLKVASATVLLLGVLSSATGFLVEAGAGFKATVVVGLAGVAGLVVIRGSGYLAQAVSKALDFTWSWAEGLGGSAEAAMAKPRKIEQRMLAAYVSAPWRHRTLAAKARTRAMWIVGIAWAGLGLGALAFLSGFFGSFSST